ncbi:MAG: potassium transporter [Rickettsiales bacterium]|nr:potassium transporter [Rickettsiales bacterium]
MKASKLLYYLGLVLVVLGAFMATAIPWALIGGARSGSLKAWVTSVVLTVGCGLVLHLIGRSGARQRKGSWRELSSLDAVEINRREAILIVSAAWLACPLFSALPFLLDGMVSNPVDALFEATSGITTTGSTILTDIESKSLPALWWRSMMQWLGGMGIIVLFIAILPQAGSGGRRLFESEAPGPTKDQLRPRIRETGLTLWKLYSGMTLLLFVILLLEGMGAFDSACHAMTTLASGGFSTRTASIGAFDSPLIEATIVVFMLLAGINFGIYYALFSGRGPAVLRDRELGAYLLLFFSSTLVVTVALIERSGGDVLLAFRHAAFQVAATVSTTGYSSDDFNSYPQFCRGLFILLIFVGAMGGSTGGGFKVSRILIVFNTAVHELRHTLHPRAVFTTRLGSKVVDPRVVASVTALLALAVASLVLGTLALSCFGLDLESAFAAAMTALFNAGPALNAQGPAGNFAGLQDGAKLLMAGMMLVGRLEFYTALALLLPGTWKNR